MLISSCTNNGNFVASITLDIDKVKKGTHKAFTLSQSGKYSIKGLSYKKAIKLYNKLTKGK